MKKSKSGMKADLDEHVLRVTERGTQRGRIYADLSRLEQETSTPPKTPTQKKKTNPSTKTTPRNQNPPSTTPQPPPRKKGKPNPPPPSLPKELERASKVQVFSRWDLLLREFNEDNTAGGR